MKYKGAVVRSVLTSRRLAVTPALNARSDESTSALRSALPGFACSTACALLSSDFNTAPVSTSESGVAGGLVLSPPQATRAAAAQDRNPIRANCVSGLE